TRDDRIQCDHPAGRGGARQAVVHLPHPGAAVADPGGPVSGDLRLPRWIGAVAGRPARPPGGDRARAGQRPTTIGTDPGGGPGAPGPGPTTTATAAAVAGW